AAGRGRQRAAARVCRPYAGESRSGSIWSWIPRSPGASDGSNCSTSPGDGGGSTRSAGGASTWGATGRVGDGKRDRDRGRAAAEGVEEERHGRKRSSKCRSEARGR